MPKSGECLWSAGRTRDDHNFVRRRSDYRSRTLDKFQGWARAQLGSLARPDFLKKFRLTRDDLNAVLSDLSALTKQV